MSLMHMKTRYRLDSGGAYPSFMEMSPPTSDGEEEEMKTEPEMRDSRSCNFPLSPAMYFIINQP